MLLYSNGKFLHSQKRLSQQGLRALPALLNSIKDSRLTNRKQVEIFDSMVASVLGYASEIWGSHRGHNVEVIRNIFCRYVLKVGTSTPNCFLFGELGHHPM